MSIDPRSYLLNQQQMAASLNISVQAFQKWKVQPTMKLGRETLYSCGDVLANRLAHQRKRLGMNLGSLEELFRQEPPG